jgi:uroporphyrinogen decarboxylase
MSETMTSRERLLTAIVNKKPDRVPVIPDFSNMIPAKMTGKPFWEIYMNNNPTLYRAYCKAAKYYGIDGWYQAYDAVSFKQKNTPSLSRTVSARTAERITERFNYHTPAGDLWEERTYPIADPPTKTVKMVKNLEEDFPRIRYFYGAIESYDASLVSEYRKLCGEDGIFTLTVGYPGMQYWIDFFDGSLQSAVYAYYDHPEIFEEWAELAEKLAIQQSEIYLSLKPDVLLLGGSGTLTLASPELIRKFALPTIQKICRMAKEAGIPTMLHSCGKSMAFLDMLVNETELNCINPLEEPPMGDAKLGEVKKMYGSRISLMGNLQTSGVMLQGSVEDVERAAKQAIDDAGSGGGFLLSTGDQCGRDTPEQNIFKLVEVAKTYGRYNS